MSPGIDRCLARLRAVFSKPALDADFAAELEDHLERLTEDNLRAGLDPAEARRQARIALGGVEQTRELHRAERGIPWLEEFGRDLGFACRVARRERGFTMVALLILAVGIGLNTTVFSLVNTVLLRPVPFAQADRLVVLTNGDPANPNRDLSNIASKVDTWEGLQATSRTLEQIEAYDPFSVRHTYRLTGMGEPETIISVSVSHGLFGMLGMKPFLGRLFLPEDGAKDAPYRVMLSNQLWRRLGSDPSIVGRTVQINGAAVEVIGVLPAADPFTSVFFPAVRVDVYDAVRNDVERNWSNTVLLIGRTKPGVTAEAVRSDLGLAVAQLKQQHPDWDKYFFANATRLHTWVTGGLHRPLLFLWIAAGLVLAIVSFNLGGLLLARGSARQKELALRCALGAGRMRLVRQLLTECFALVAAGSLLGGLAAGGFVRFLSVRSGVEIPLLQSLRLDASALGFTVLLGVLTVLLCGVLPAWRLARAGALHAALKDEGRGSAGGPQRSRTHRLLVTLEVALACGLAISAGLAVRSLFNLLQADLGFEPRNLIAVRIDPVVSGSQVNYLEGLLDRVRALPGVERAAVTDCVPVERDRSWALYPVIKDHPDDQRWTGAHIRLVSPGLLAAMGTTLVAGRDFTRIDRKGQPGVIVVNRTLADRFWPAEDPLGREVLIGGQYRCTVIGVAADVRHSGPELPSGNEMYLPVAQVEDASSWDLLVRTKLPVASLTAGLRTALRDVDATLPLTKARLMTSLVDRTLSSRRLLVSLVGGFAGIAVGLAALGLYGLISYMVNRQTKEIGIRMALGASAGSVRREIVGRTMRLTGWGLALGLGGTIAASRLLQSLLYGISATDVATYVVMMAVLGACALVAGYIPARRASRVDPLIALRAE